VDGFIEGPNGEYREWWIWHDEPNPESDTPGLVQLRAYRDSLKGGDAT
jgi:hypothetical protein